MDDNFNSKVLNKVNTTLFGYNLEIAEEYKGYIRLTSPTVILIVSLNERENTIDLFWGRPNKHTYYLDEDLIKEFFNVELRFGFSVSGMESRINKIFNFLILEGSILLAGDENLYNMIEEFTKKRSEIYTKNLLLRQKLTLADRAWQGKYYREFVAIILEIGLENVSIVYKKKFEIASKMLLLVG